MRMMHHLHVWIAQAFYSWVIQEINPLHPDVSKIVFRRMELEEKRKMLCR